MAGSSSKRQRIDALVAELEEEDKEQREQELSTLRAAHTSLTEKHDALSASHAALSGCHEATCLALLSQLPRYSRYSQFTRTVMAPEDAVSKHLRERLISSVVRHRRHPATPHCSPPKLSVVRIERILNPRLQEKYLAEVQDVAGLCERKVAPLHTEQADTFKLAGKRVESYHGLNVNEYLLFHGAQVGLIDRLVAQGLDPRYAGENAGKLFGSGSYFAVNSSKSDIYTAANAAGERCILVARVCLGEAALAKEACPDVTRPPERPDNRGPLNSIVAVPQVGGGCVEHPEFIVCHSLPPPCMLCSLSWLELSASHLPPRRCSRRRRRCLSMPSGTSTSRAVRARIATWNQR